MNSVVRAELVWDRVRTVLVGANARDFANGSTTLDVFHRRVSCIEEMGRAGGRRVMVANFCSFPVVHSIIVTHHTVPHGRPCISSDTAMITLRFLQTGTHMRWLEQGTPRHSQLTLDSPTSSPRRLGSMRESRRI